MHSARRMGFKKKKERPRLYRLIVKTKALLYIFLPSVLAGAICQKLRVRCDRVCHTRGRPAGQHQPHSRCEETHKLFEITHYSPCSESALSVVVFACAVRMITPYTVYPKDLMVHCEKQRATEDH